MKIALITTDFLPNIGGVTQHVVEIARALMRGGDEVEVIAPFHEPDWRNLQKQPFREVCLGIPTWRIPLVLNTSIRFVSGQVSSRLSEYRLERELLRRLNETQPELVHWHALESRHHPLIRWSKSPKVWTNHTSYFITGIASGRRKQYLREAADADEIIAPSEELCGLTASLGIPRDRIHFIPNGVDSSRFTPGTDSSYWRQRLNLGEHRQLILCPRRLERKNGVSYFIQAAISILKENGRDIVFAVAGDFSGPRAESDEALVLELVKNSSFADRFHLLGRVENDDMPGLYACSTIVVLPSLMEATSLSAMEAMACGKPVIATNVGGLPFLVHDGENGFLVPPRQSAELAKLIKRLLDSPQQMMEFGNNGRIRVEKELDWQNIASQTKQIYNRAVKRHAGCDN